MNNAYKNQSGVSSSTPSPLKRWLISKAMTYMHRPERLQKQRLKREAQRQKEARAHVVEYFHDVADGYSHLAAQLLDPLQRRYNIEIRCHLVGAPAGDNAPEPELLLQLSRTDSEQVAPHYGLSFPHYPQAPTTEAVTLAREILAQQDNEDFLKLASQVGKALWQGNLKALTALAEQHGKQLDSGAAMEQGNARRSELKHYSSAMFFYEGEWYWGVDRLYHLEQRLQELGADRLKGALLAPRPLITTNNTQDKDGVKSNGNLTLEFYASLRSPYTAMIFDTVVQFAKDAEITLALKPILPMVMRGVPATREKGMYIFFDCYREARALGTDFDQFYDPIGEPVKRAYSLYAWACTQDKGVALMSAFFNCAFSQGINTNNDRGLQKVLQQAGLDWQQAQPYLDRDGWQAELENNRQTLYNAGCWGVPSFRLLDQQGNALLTTWGQDRLWLVAKTVQQQLG
jgi:2-hydroxychromene-2-carboxylate isomerase